MDQRLAVGDSGTDGPAHPEGAALVGEEAGHLGSTAIPARIRNGVRARNEPVHVVREIVQHGCNIAAAVSLSNVLAQTKALDVLTSALFAWMQPYITGTWASTMVLYWSAFAYHIVIGNEIAMLSTSLPLLMTYAREHGLNPLTLGMVWTFGAGPKLFIYESAVLVVGYSYGYFGNKDMLKVGGLLSIVTALILMLLVPLYWPLIGIGG